MNTAQLDHMLGLAVTTVLRRAGLLSPGARMETILWKDRTDTVLFRHATRRFTLELREMRDEETDADAVEAPFTVEDGRPKITGPAMNPCDLGDDKPMGGFHDD